MKTCFPYLNTSKLDEDSQQTQGIQSHYTLLKDVLKKKKTQLVAPFSLTFKVLYTMKRLITTLRFFVETFQLSLTFQFPEAHSFPNSTSPLHQLHLSSTPLYSLPAFLLNNYILLTTGIYLGGPGPGNVLQRQGKDQRVQNYSRHKTVLGSIRTDTGTKGSDIRSCSQQGRTNTELGRVKWKCTSLVFSRGQKQVRTEGL